MKGWIIAIVMAAIFAAGFYLGDVWSAHHHDAANIKTLTGQLGATQQAFDQSQTDWTQAIQQFRHDSAALAAIAQEYSHDRDSRTRYFGILNDRLTHALAARPDLADCALGADGLRLWNDANRGAPAAAANAAAAAPDRRGVAASVPAAAAGQKQQAAGSGTQPSADHRALPRLRGPALENHPGGAQTRSDRDAPRGVRGRPPHASRLALMTAATGEWP